MQRYKVKIWKYKKGELFNIYLSAKGYKEAYIKAKEFLIQVYGEEKHTCLLEVEKEK